MGFLLGYPWLPEPGLWAGLFPFLPGVFGLFWLPFARCVGLFIWLVCLLPNVDFVRVDVLFLFYRGGAVRCFGSFGDPASCTS